MGRFSGCPYCGGTDRFVMRCRRCGRRRRVRGRRFYAFLLLLLVLVALVLLRDLRQVREGPESVELTSLGPRYHFLSIRVVGQLAADAAPLGNDGCFFRLAEGDDVLVDVFLEKAPEALFRAGSRVEVIGRVMPTADGSLRLTARSAVPAPLPINGLEPSEEGCLLAELDAADVGRCVEVAGRVETVREPGENSRAPHRLLLNDGSGQLPVVHWLGEAAACSKGDLVRVRGTISVFRGQLELKVEDAADLTVIRATSAATPADPHGS